MPEQARSAAASAPEGWLVACAQCGAKNRVQPDRAREATCGRCHVTLFPPRAVPTSEATFARDVESAPLPVLVDFWAPWCGPCRAIAPALEQIAAAHVGRLKVVKVNVDENPGLSARFQVQAIPTLAVFQGGRLVDQIRGALPKRELEARLARYF